MKSLLISYRIRLLSGVAAAAVIACAGAAQAQDKPISIAPQPLSAALYELGVQTGQQIIFTPALASAKTSRGAAEAEDVELALSQVLQGTGLTYRRTADAFLIVEAGPGASGPQYASADGGAGSNAVDALVVTAQKKEEAIQDVPIAISAFSQQALDAQKIEGGFDLLKAIPNVSFSKNNFTSYNFSIRGIGTKAISVSTDPGVAVEFNDTPLIRNRLFEQEYFDIKRVEVLRGPQGTLHGRNATAGAINVISETARQGKFDGWMKAELGNYQTRRVSGMINMPLAGEVLAMRLAGAMTSRDGYDYNATTGNQINGRDLWSGRLSLAFEPTETFRADLIWERFHEDDDRSRTGKQLCHHDAGPEEILGLTNLHPIARAYMSTGCKAGSLYDDAAFGTPNGLTIPFILVANDEFIGDIGFTLSPDPFGRNPQGSPLKHALDPYGNMRQSTDLRTINSVKDPRYRASTDVIELNASFDITPDLTLTSQTAYSSDEIYSFQDFNRFNSLPVFQSTTDLLEWEEYAFGPTAPSRFRNLIRDGVYCDPQLGCSDTIVGFDISQAESSQFSQEFRLQSNFDGPLNFSAGVNYLHYETLEDYYVMFNLITLVAQMPGNLVTWNGSPTIDKCRKWVYPPGEYVMVDLYGPDSQGCVYIDPNPAESIDGEGHNYFRSKNPYSINSTATFGEVYWQAGEALNITAGLRYTDDRKTFTPHPTQVLMSSTPWTLGTVDKGYPAKPDIKLKWGEVTGRLGFDWKPDLAFTDETMVYGFFSRGYKGGGMNPPTLGFNVEYWEQFGITIGQNRDTPETFKPEYVNAFEVGAKNVLADGALVFNIGAFYYDYEGYQVSKIVDRSAATENFDATVWGVEIESVFAPTKNLRMNLAFGYLDTNIADGSQSLNLMDRVQGHDEYTTFKPALQLTSNCVLPKEYIANSIAELRAGDWSDGSGDYLNMILFCPGFVFGVVDPATLPNGGAGFFEDIGGNDLPNSPHWTVSFGAEHKWDLLDGAWRLTLRGDAYWQSQSWARVYNDDPYDKLHGWYNTNLSLWVENDEGLKIEVYAKNLLDDTPITDAFLNSDDAALTTNIFVLDPRLIGVSIKQAF